MDAQIALNPNITEFTGDGVITLDGRGSTGSNLSYQWAVDSQHPELYTIDNANQSVATLTLSNPQAAGSLTIALVVTSGSASDSATRTLVHRPSVASQWFDLGPVTSEPQPMTAGDRVSIRTVSATGQDAFWPASPVVLTAATAPASAWPLALGQAVDAMNGAVRIGVLNAQDQVVPMQSATANRIFALTTANIVSAFLQIVPASVPPAPTGLTASAGNAQVQLAWNAAAGATSYNVKRSTTNGGPYSNVATGVTATSFTNTGLTNGTPYFYVVTAVNDAGESPISNQAGATPVASNFSLSASPASVAGSRGASAGSTITIGRTAFTGSVSLSASGLPSGVTASFNPPSTTGTSSTVTFTASATATLGTATVTISGSGGGMARTVPIALTVNPGGNTGGVTVTRAATTLSPWFNEQQVRITNTASLTALTVTIVVQRTTGISFNGLYNTVGGQIQQANGSTTGAVTYTFTLAAGQTVSPGTDRTFAAQTRGTGTAHPTAGDTYTVTYTVGGATFTQSGTF